MKIKTSKRSSLKKKKPKQSKRKENFHKNTTELSCVGQLIRGMSPARSNTPGDIQLEKTDFPVVKGLQRVSWLVVGADVYCSLLVLRPCLA